MLTVRLDRHQLRDVAADVLLFAGSEYYSCVCMAL